MASVESEGLQKYLDEVIAATSAGKIPWKSVNPTTFVWETGNAKVSLQRVERITQVSIPPVQLPGRPPLQQRMAQVASVSYVFQAFDMGRPNVPILNLESSMDKALDQKLQDLFDLVKTGVSQKTLDFLRSILPSD